MGVSTTARRVLVWTGCALALAAGLVGLFAWQSERAYRRVLAEYERQVGPADHAHFVPNPLPEELNAAVMFAAALDRVEAEGAWVRASEPAAWRPEEADAARAVVARHARALELLDAAAALDGCSWPAIPATEPAWSGPMLAASRLLRLAGFVAVLDGDSKRVERAFGALGRLAECLHRQPHIVGAIVATAVERARLEVVRAAVASTNLGGATAERIELDLSRSLEEDRVARALAAEGAFVLRFIENPGLTGGSSRVYPLFSRRVAARLAERWIDLHHWSREPLEELLEGQGVAPGTSGLTAVIANLLIPNLADAVVKMRTGERLTRIALAALEARRNGGERGSYEGALAERMELEIRIEAAGGAVLRDARLEALLRSRYLGPDGRVAPGIEATLALTSWRLPALGTSTTTPGTAP